MATTVVWVLGWGSLISTTDSAPGAQGSDSAPRTAPSGGPSAAALRRPSSAPAPTFRGPGHLGGLEASSQLPLLQQPLGDGLCLIMPTQLQLLHQRVGGGLNGVQGLPVYARSPVVFV